MRSRRINTQQNGSSPNKDVTSATQGCRLRYRRNNQQLPEKVAKAKPALLSATCSATNRNRLERTAASYTCVKHQQTTETPEEIHESKSRLLTACTAILLIRTIVMSATILITTSNLQAPTWTIFYAIILASVIAAPLLVHSTLAYLPSPGNSNQNVARVNPWNRILKTTTRTHGKQERDTKRSVPI
jgi:uncharacterized membrane protein